MNNDSLQQEIKKLRDGLARDQKAQVTCTAFYVKASEENRQQIEKGVEYLASCWSRPWPFPSVRRPVKEEISFLETSRHEVYTVFFEQMINQCVETHRQSPKEAEENIKNRFGLNKQYSWPG